MAKSRRCTIKHPWHPEWTKTVDTFKDANTYMMSKVKKHAESKLKQAFDHYLGYRRTGVLNPVTNKRGCITPSKAEMLPKKMRTATLSVGSFTVTVHGSVPADADIKILSAADFRAERSDWRRDSSLAGCENIDGMYAISAKTGDVYAVSTGLPLQKYYDMVNDGDMEMSNAQDGIARPYYKLGNNGKAPQYYISASRLFCSVFVGHPPTPQHQCDHLEPLFEKPELVLVVSNLQWLTAAAHQVKTNEENTRRADQAAVAAANTAAAADADPAAAAAE